MTLTDWWTIEQIAIGIGGIVFGGLVWLIRLEFRSKAQDPEMPRLWSMARKNKSDIESMEDRNERRYNRIETKMDRMIEVLHELVGQSKSRDN